MNVIQNTEIIFNYIKQNKLTHRQFCKLCQITYNTYVYAINKNHVRRDVISKIAKILNVKISVLTRPTTYKYNMDNINLNLIKNFMSENNLTKRDFCNLCAIRTLYYWFIFNKNAIDEAIIERIAYFMNIKPEDLFLTEQN